MDYRQLGTSGLFVSSLTLGSVAFTPGDDRGGATVDLDNARHLLALAMDAGVTLVDTADSYGTGVAEEVVGEIVKDHPGVLVSTKVAFPTGPTPNDRGLSRRHVLTSADNSLRRLRRDHIDLYHLHLWDGLTPVEETLDALASLVQSGKVRYVAVSNFSAWHVMKFLAGADAMGAPRPIAQQIHYTPHVRDAEFELLPLAADQGLGTLVWSPLGGGLLSGKYRRDQSPDSGRFAGAFSEPPVPDEARLYDIVDELVAVARERNATPAQVALAYTLSRPGVTSAIVGARRPEQLLDNLGSADLALSDDDLGRIERVSRPVVPYPYWHQLTWDADRLGPAERSILAPYLP
ncbi:aldo/keto reductase [Acidothermaceae bacterium B102]|nr:aldo/keto reductase [Acidothermaceae bacterium B102]